MVNPCPRLGWSGGIWRGLWGEEMRGLLASLLIPRDLLGAGLRAEEGVQGTVCGPHRSAPLTCFSTVLRAGLRGQAAAQLVDSCSSDSITQPHGSRVKCSKKQINPERKGAPRREKWWRPWPTFSSCRSHFHFSGEQPKCSTLESGDVRGEDDVWHRGMRASGGSGFWAQTKESQAGDCTWNLTRPFTSLVTWGGNGVGDFC